MEPSASSPALAPNPSARRSPAARRRLEATAKAYVNVSIDTCLTGMILSQWVSGANGRSAGSAELRHRRLISRSGRHGVWAQSAFAPSADRAGRQEQAEGCGQTRNEGMVALAARRELDLARAVGFGSEPPPVLRCQDGGGVVVKPGEHVGSRPPVTRSAQARGASLFGRRGPRTGRRPCASRHALDHAPRQVVAHRGDQVFLTGGRRKCAY